MGSVCSIPCGCIRKARQRVVNTDIFHPNTYDEACKCKTCDICRVKGDTVKYNLLDSSME